MNEPTLRAMFQSLLIGQKRHLETESLNILNYQVVKADKLVVSFAAEQDKILKDPSRSDAGKTTAVAKLAEATVQDFAPLGRVLAEAQATHTRDLARALAPLSTPKDVTEPAALLRELVGQLRAQEIRASLPPDDHGREGAFLKALEMDEVETARAILDAPGARWISTEIRQRGQEAYLQRTDPAGFAHLTSMEILREHLHTLASAINTWLIRMGVDAKKVAAILGLEQEAV